ncbi:WD40 repeat-like protein [Neoconidiobolus thromboides FSU 785]|nr:WD40 repeat-like protein [Neoconidiobolus thromboides FSU 785]
MKIVLKNDIRSRGSGLNIVKYSSDGNYCFSGGNDKTIRLWNYNQSESNNLIYNFEGHGWEIYDLDVSSDSSRLASCGGDRSVFSWDIESTSIIRKFSGHSHKVNSIAFNEDASVIASGSFDTTVRLWDCKSRSHLPIQILEDSKDSISSISIQGPEILVGSVDNKVRLYDLRMGKLYTDTMPASVTNVGFTKDGNCLIISTLDSTIRLLDKSNGSLLNHFNKHTNQSYMIGAACSYDDSLVITGSEDKRIYVYDLMEGTVVQSLDFHQRSVTSVAAHPKKKEFIACSTDGRISIWAY